MDAPTAQWLVVGGAIASTFVWRALGVLLAASIDPQGRLFRWGTCVSYAMLAGLIARMLILPIGVLAETTLTHRLGALGLAFAVFFGRGRRLGSALLAGVLAFIAWAAL